MATATGGETPGRGLRFLPKERGARTAQPPGTGLTAERLRGGDPNKDSSAGSALSLPCGEGDGSVSFKDKHPPQGNRHLPLHGRFRVCQELRMRLPAGWAGPEPELSGSAMGAGPSPAARPVQGQGEGGRGRGRGQPRVPAPPPTGTALPGGVPTSLSGFWLVTRLRKDSQGREETGAERGRLFYFFKGRKGPGAR